MPRRFIRAVTIYILGIAGDDTYLLGMEIYSPEILRAAANLPAPQRLDAPDKTVVKTSRICGSRLILDVTLSQSGDLADYGMTVKACALGQASCSLMAAQISKLDPAEFIDFAAEFRSWLSEDGELDWEDHPNWQGFSLFAPARAMRARHGAVMLPFDALQDVFDQ